MNFEKIKINLRLHEMYIPGTVYILIIKNILQTHLIFLKT